MPYDDDLLRLAAFLFLAITFTIRELPAQTATFTAPVIGITDGDTIRVLHDGTSERIRLWGIDCPESKPFGTRAKQFTSGLVFGKNVYVFVRDHDRYGRTVAEIVLPDGRNLNRELVKAGFAWWYVQFAKHNPELGDLEADARKAGRGLWADPHPIPPWEWRKGLRRSS